MYGAVAEVVTQTSLSTTQVRAYRPTVPIHKDMSKRRQRSTVGARLTGSFGLPRSIFNRATGGVIDLNSLARIDPRIDEVDHVDSNGGLLWCSIIPVFEVRIHRGALRVCLLRDELQGPRSGWTTSGHSAGAI